jgi:bifunctional non-homologous end joining protein LigD
VGVAVEYRRRRDFRRTEEPLGSTPSERIAPTWTGSFAVHLHASRRAHYDLRIEVSGVLASFAIPKGPSLDPSDKRLSIRTEDHPIEYLEFEGVIPAGNYGAGAMILWDSGRVHYEGASGEEGLEHGKLEFRLSGYKLRGLFALIRLKGSASGNEWLLLKLRESEPGVPMAELSPRSVLSGLTVEELPRASLIAQELEAHAAELGAPSALFDGRAIAPMLCAIEGAPLRDAGWLYELKLDGARILAIKDERGVALRYRRARDATAAYPEVARAVRALPTDRAVLDGEVVAFDASGRPSFQRLGRRIHVEPSARSAHVALEVPVVYLVFDLLALGGRDLRQLPLVARKRLLGELCRGVGALRVLDHLEDDGLPLLEFCRAHRLEGLVAKRKDSVYRSGPRRTGDWVKLKLERDDEFVVVGYTRGEGSRSELGALDVASYEGGELIYRGKVGSGLDDATIASLSPQLRALEVPTFAARGRLDPAPRGRVFVRPELVVSVRFLGYSQAGHLRSPVFRGVRLDKAPRECAASPERVDLVPAHDVYRPARPPRHVAVTNPQKVLFPEAGYTKADLVAYYQAIAAVMLPHLRHRPIMMVRYPDGIDAKQFYQWRVPARVPSFIHTARLRIEDEHNKETEVFVVDNEETLIYIANLGCIPIHILAARVESLDACDFLTVDFDLKSAPLALAVELARSLRELLARIDLPGFVKTSGQSGLHVLVPLGPGVSFVTARHLADLMGWMLCRRHPRTATQERTIAKRDGRVYVDTGQTGMRRTIVAPYAVRATPQATVSTPLGWDELTVGFDPAAWTLKTVPDRVAREGDPMAPMLDARPELAGAIDRLEALARTPGAW